MLRKGISFLNALYSPYSMGLNILVVTEAKRPYAGGVVAVTCRALDHSAKHVFSVKGAVDELEAACYDAVVVDEQFGPDDSYAREVASRARELNPGVDIYMIRRDACMPTAGREFVDWYLPPNQEWLEFIFGGTSEQEKPLNTPPSQQTA
jgi:hypothetical protein